MKKILIFGAGKIGRAFIGQLFSNASYEVVFVDAVQSIVDLLNQHQKYNVVIRDLRPDIITVENVRAIHARDNAKVVAEIIDTDLIVTCVGLNALPLIAPVIAEGLLKKYVANPDSKTDIILAENLRNAAFYFSGQIASHLPKMFPLANNVGFIETSIGKMVPIMSDEDMAEDPLQVFAEAYNTLIVDGKGFKNPIPNVQGLAPKENIKAWVDRKLFIHNMGHAIAAYFGNYYHPEKEYLYEVLADKKIEDLTRAAMQESGAVLRAIYPQEFTKQDIDNHIDDLINRFENRLLGDTVYRVGSDLKRKLGKSDRIATPIRYAIQYQLPFDHILKGYKAALCFYATLNNAQHPDDIFIIDQYKKKGIEFIMKEISGIDPEKCLRNTSKEIV